MIQSLPRALKALALATCLALPAASNAEVLLTDNFDAYSTGALYGQGEWIRLDKKTDNPIQVTGGAAVLNGLTSSNAERLKKAFADDGITSGMLAYSATICPESVNTGTSKYAFIGFAGKNYSGFGDGVGNSSIYAVVSLASSDVEGRYRIGIAASTSTPTYAPGDYDCGTPVTVAVTYDFTTKNICLYVNPADADAAPTVTLAGKGSISTTNGVQGICLHQGCSSLAQAEVKVDDIIVGTTLADVLGNGGTGPVDPPVGDEAKATVTPATVTFATTLQGMAVTQTVKVKAEGLTESLALSTTNAVFTVEPATLSADEAMAGATVTVTFKPDGGSSYKAALNVAHAGTNIASAVLQGSAFAVTTPMNYAWLSNLLFDGDAEDYTYYSMESRFGTVTHVDPATSRFFIQDISGALEVRCDYYKSEMSNIKTGDKVSQFYVMPEAGYLYLAMPIEASKVTAGTPKTPTEATLADIAQDPGSYWNKLVTVTDLSFAKAGDTFAASSTAATDAAGRTVQVRPFAGTDLIGTTIPAKAAVTGIVVAKSGTTLWPRSAADIEAEAADEPSLETSVQNHFDGVAAPIGQTTKLSTITFTAVNLPAPATLWVSGTGRDMFSLSTEEIPAGTGTYAVDVFYTPTKIGAHRANVGIDATPTYLSGSLSVNCKAYDPDNLPVITAPAALEPFTAEAGAQQQQQFTITSANMIEAGNVKIAEQSAPGTFIINSTSLYPNITATFTVTFKPQAAGTYTATIAVEGLMAETRLIQLTGTATGEIPAEEKEGTELTLDTSNPLKLMVQDFEGAVRNKPLMIAGWDNVAMQGTRAWWGYDFEDGNHAAKVTVYDSKATENTPAQMLLVTPALDFKGADSKLLTFRVMGDFLPEAADRCNLEVLYIEDADYMESLGNLGLPCTSDHNKEWVDLMLDLEDLDLADTFFIGFLYTAERGTENTTVYYVDDVTWGRTDLPQIKARTADNKNAATAGVEMRGFVGATTTSDALTIQGKNLKESIMVNVTGAHASKFSTSAEMLPDDGGQLHIHFTPQEAGVHEAYVQLSSQDAPTLSIPVAALSEVDDPSGITDIEADGANAEVYNLQGIRLTGRVGVKDLPSGIYIIGGKKVSVK